jgi:hypothetical protein
MKISKIAIAVLFTAGFLTTSASASMATDCLDGSYVEVGVNATCPPVDGDVEVKPIDSCWTTEDGSDVCARGVPVPMTVTSEEETPVDVSEETLVGGGDCTVSVDADGNELNACYDAVPYEATGEEGEVMPLEEGTVDETLMYQSGIAKSGAMPNDQTASNTLAAFGVLVGALGAFGIAISRERAAK